MTWVKYDVKGLDSMIKEVERISGQPSFRLLGGLEETLQLAFLDTQAKTHIITGSLKASGKKSSTWQAHDRRWEGTITYGGPLVGSPLPGPPNDPVEYAIYEMARGGAHDFFRDLPSYDPLYVESIMQWMEGSV